jgi:transcriptional regulator GlxA family with amidase domain
VIAKTLEPVSTQVRDAGVGSICRQSIVPTHTFESPPQDLDVVLVPGGKGVREDMTAEIEFLRVTYPKLKYIFSVCTGSTLFARAGILDGRQATTNKMSWEWATSTGPNVNWVRKARWVVDGNIWTTSGVAAGMDGFFAFVGEIWGEEVTNDLSKILEYERHADSSWDPFARVHGLVEA